MLSSLKSIFTEPIRAVIIYSELILSCHRYHFLPKSFINTKWLHKNKCFCTNVEFVGVFISFDFDKILTGVRDFSSIFVSLRGLRGCQGPLVKDGRRYGWAREAPWGGPEHRQDGIFPNETLPGQEQADGRFEARLKHVGGTPDLLAQPEIILPGATTYSIFSSTVSY